MQELFNDNSVLIIAIAVFVLCVIIGFFGDLYLRKQNKIGKILDGDNIGTIKTTANDSSSNTVDNKVDNSTSVNDTSNDDKQLEDKKDLDKAEETKTSVDNSMTQEDEINNMF